MENASKPTVLVRCRGITKEAPDSTAPPSNPFSIIIDIMADLLFPILLIGVESDGNPCKITSTDFTRNEGCSVSTTLERYPVTKGVATDRVSLWSQ